MILSGRKDLLDYFGVRTCAALEKQFNSDGRLTPVLIDAKVAAVLLATHSRGEPTELSTLVFPFHVSDFLGQIELDRRAAELKALT